MLRQIVSAAGGLLLLCGAQVQADSSADVERAIKSLPDASIEAQQQADGSISETVKLPSGVSFVIHHPQKGGTNVTGLDNSGHGAVMCAWEIYVKISIAADICSATDKEDITQRLSGAIRRIDGFIIENSPTPMSQADLDRRKERIRADAIAALARLSNDEATRKCRTDDASRMLERLKSQPAEKFEMGVDDLLSVPRPPVMNPCL
jgi:hypothetical protein